MLGTIKYTKEEKLHQMQNPGTWGSGQVDQLPGTNLLPITWILVIEYY